jgi:hypothetical protein
VQLEYIVVMCVCVSWWLCEQAQMHGERGNGLDSFAQVFRAGHSLLVLRTLMTEPASTLALVQRVAAKFQFVMLVEPRLPVERMNSDAQVR